MNTRRPSGGVSGLENDGFCQSFYGAVVAKLEDDAKLLMVGNY
jgi:hypothetical protein